MEIDTPADAWLIWLGVALVSVGLGSVVFSLPTQPPPDATKAVNTIDRVASSSHTAAARYEHDATEAKIGPRQLSLRNDGGTRHGTVAFGSVTPVAVVPDPDRRQALRQIARGENVTALVTESAGIDERDLWNATVAARSRLAVNGRNWMQATDHLAVRKLTLAGKTVVLVAV